MLVWVFLLHFMSVPLFFPPAGCSSFLWNGRQEILSVSSPLYQSRFTSTSGRMQLLVHIHFFPLCFLDSGFALSFFTFLILYGRRHHLPLPFFAASDLGAYTRTHAGRSGPSKERSISLEPARMVEHWHNPSPNLSSSSPWTRHSME